MEKSLKCLPRFVALSVRTHSRINSCVSPLCFTINQSHGLHDKGLNPKFIKDDISTIAAIDEEKKIWLGKKIKLMVQGFFSTDTKISYAADIIYQSIADGIEIPEFFHYFQMPDTFQSWFLVIQLHVWMMMVRTVNEGPGRIMSVKLTKVMWNDVEARVGKLEGIKSSLRKENLKTMYEQFNAALISYDEGFFNQDTVLAAAVWRTFFFGEYTDPRLLESMVVYIRKQVDHLDSLNTQELMLRGRISWIPLKEIVSDLDKQRS